MWDKILFKINIKGHNYKWGVILLKLTYENKIVRFDEISAEWQL